MLDKKDLRILECLRANSKLTSQQIYKKTLIPITTIHNRVKRMEKDGIIKGYTVILDHKKLGYGIAAYVLVTVKYFTSEGKTLSQTDLAKRISLLPGVEEVHIVTGGTDIICKARVKDVESLNEFVINSLRNIEGVENTQTIIVLSSPES